MQAWPRNPQAPDRPGFDSARTGPAIPPLGDRSGPWSLERGAGRFAPAGPATEHAIRTKDGLWLGDFAHWTRDEALAFRFSTVTIALWYATHELGLDLGSFTVEEIHGRDDNGPGLPRRR
jgi:hypothetical protein